MRTKLAVAAYLLVAVGAAFIVDRADGDTALLGAEAVLLIASLIVGFLVADWRVVGLAVLPGVVSLPLGELDADRGDVFGYGAAIQGYMVVPCAICLLVGWIAAWFWQRSAA